MSEPLQDGRHQRHETNFIGIVWCPQEMPQKAWSLRLSFDTSSRLALRWLVVRPNHTHARPFLSNIEVSNMLPRYYVTSAYPGTLLQSPKEGKTSPSPEKCPEKRESTESKEPGQERRTVSSHLRRRNPTYLFVISESRIFEQRVSTESQAQ